MVALSACGVPSSPPNEDPVLQRGLSAQPESLDPQLARSVASGKVLGDMYEGLYTRDAAGQRVAGVIEDGGMALSGDARRYTFTLRTDARWSDGSPVTAADFVRGWRFLADPDNAAFYADLITPLENARDIAIGAKLPSTLGVSARDAHTLDVVLTAPQPDFLERLAHPALAPRAPDANLTNGAYRLASVASGGVVSMHANPYFHAADTVAIKAVNYTSYEQEQTEYNAFRSGALDITSRVPRQLFLGDAPKPDTLRVTPYLGVAFLTMNMREPPSLALRRALSLAIDRVALAEDVLARGETPAYGLVPPGTRNGEEDYQVYLPDHAMLDATARIAAARTAMAQAMATAERAPQITLSYASSDENRVVALALQAMWREVLPELTVTLINKEFRVLLAEARSGQFDGMIRS
ncbi:MAG: peptide ABC transporter substrate-binding protein, partial [Pseudomonadota bacterium]